MKSNLNIGLLIIVLGLQLLYTGACTKKDMDELKREKPEKQLQDNPPFSGGRIKIVHLYKDTVYTLSNTFIRQNGEQLIIEPGTLIKCSGLSASIQIQPGGIILANGAETDPVVFTSSSYTGTQKSGDWQGIIIEGRSVNNNSFAGTPDITDFSGTLRYVRIEFAPLTLKSIGNRSVVENVQVSYASGGPAFKFDGGNFNARNLVSFACNSQADFYFTNGFQGRLQNLLAYRHPYFANETGAQNLLTGLYVENNEFGNFIANPKTYIAVSNASIFGPGINTGVNLSYVDTSFRNAALVTTGNSFFKIRNSLFTRFPAGGWYLDDALTSENLVKLHAECAHTVFDNSAGNRSFLLIPGSFNPFGSADFKTFMLDPRFNNHIIDSLGLEDPYNYENPKPWPSENSILLKASDFSGPFFSDPFFDKQPYIGALGKSNWMAGWGNFSPLKTRYNNYE